MKFENIEYEEEDGIGWIRLNRPEAMNAMNIQTYNELVEAIDQAEKDDNTKVIILTGKGKAFSAGQDTKEAARLDLRDSEIWQNYVDTTTKAADRLEGCEKPTIAGVNGPAHGGGLEFTLLCDIVIASEKAEFATPEGKMGIIPGTGVAKIQPVVGKHIAMDLMLTGDPIGAEEAVEVGLANEVVKHEKLEDALREKAQAVKQVKSRSHRAIKSLWKENSVLGEKGRETWDFWRDELVRLQLKTMEEQMPMGPLPEKPLPEPQPWTEKFWEGTRDNKLLIPYCKDCGKPTFYPKKICPNCGSTSWKWVESEGKGKVFTYSTIYDQAHPAFTLDTPYTVAIVELEEEVRMLSNIIECDPEDVELDAPVEVTFDEVTDEVTLPKFRLRDED